MKTRKSVRHMTRSPLALVRAASATAAKVLPPYSSKFSRKDFTQHQLFALLVLREFLKTDYRGLEQLLRDWSDLRQALCLCKVPDHSTLQKAFVRLLKKKDIDALFQQTVTQACAIGLIGPKPRGVIDATGYETRHISRYFFWRAGKRRRGSFWPKLTAVLETETHFFLSAHVTRGPSHDSPQFKHTVRAAQAGCPLDTLLGDTAYDSEHNHIYGRERLRIRSTVFPLNPRNTGRRWPKTRYRRQMHRRFRSRSGHRSRRVYGQRWQIESGWSRNKRRLGSALRARIWANQKNEVRMRIVTHNLMLLADPKDFDRATICLN